MSVRTLFSPLCWLSSLLSLSPSSLCPSALLLSSLSYPSPLSPSAFLLYPQLYLLTQTVVEHLWVLQSFFFWPLIGMLINQSIVQLVLKNKNLKSKSETLHNRFHSQPVQPSSVLNNIQKVKNLKSKLDTSCLSTSQKPNIRRLSTDSPFYTHRF